MQYAELAGFAARHDDGAAFDHDLVHEPCGSRICTVEVGDDLGVLAMTASAHLEECSGPAGENTTAVRYHSSGDMDGARELSEVTEPVAVVIRPGGSVDVYGCVAVIDQRTA